MKIALLILLFCFEAQALDLSVTPIGRSYPTSGTIEIQARDEYLLWDQRSDAKWKFGFVQPRLNLAAHGLWEGTLSLFPVSILELGASFGGTSRYYNTKPFDCDANVCKGFLQRQKSFARLALAQEISSFQLLGIAAYHRIRFATADNSKPFVDESEVLSGHPGSDTAECVSLMVGAQQDGRTVGVYARKARMLDSQAENQSQYLMYRQKQQDGWIYTLGLGRYASDFHEPGFSAIASASWSWGESISLF